MRSASRARFVRPVPGLAALVASALLAVGCGGGSSDGDAASAADGEAPATAQQVGSVTFPTSCSPEVQPKFEEAVAMLHSFWFEPAEAAFREVAADDPDCAMAHWGIAMTQWGNPIARAAPSPERVEVAVEAVEAARTLSADATDRERMYVEAVAALYDDHATTGHLERMRAHEKAMRALMEAHPEDPEATIFYGRIVVANAPPDDLTFERQRYAAGLMEPIFEERPDHPGLAHYIIHAYDAPSTAARGEDAAFRYADIAPDAPHALHMPSHIFTRLGYWHESIETNARSALASPVPDAAVHPLDYMVYAHLQLGQDDAAGEVVRRARNAADRFYGGMIGYNYAALQARYALERERWADAADLEPSDEALPFVQAVTRFARGIGAARAGQPERARADEAALGELVTGLREAGDDYWATVVEAQRLAVGAWIARAEGRDAEALDLARRAADLEDTVEKHAVTPGPILPARELLGDLLMELGRPGEALRAYEATLEREPRRARALHGAARAAEAAGETDVARERYGELMELMADADPDRPERAAAERFLGAG